MSKSLDLSIQVRKMGKKPISYSQYNMYKSCPKRWKLTYIDKHREFEPSIFLIFGTAIHEIIQEYLTKVYNETAVEADKMDFGPLLRTKLQELYVKTVQEDNDGKHYSTPQQLGEFYEDGIEILNYLRKKRNIYFEFLPPALEGELGKKIGHCPSTGLLTLYWIYKILKL